MKTNAKNFLWIYFPPPTLARFCLLYSRTLQKMSVLGISTISHLPILPLIQLKSFFPNTQTKLLLLIIYSNYSNSSKHSCIAHRVPGTVMSLLCVLTDESSQQSSGRHCYYPIVLMTLRRKLSNSSQVIILSKWWSHELNLDRLSEICALVSHCLPVC